MIGTITSNIARFLVLLLLQVLVLDHMDLANGWITVYLYVLFILMLPFETPQWAVLLIGFVTGCVVDHFTNTPGLHASATVLLAFARHYVLRLLAPREGYEFGSRPNIPHMGPNWFMAYAGILVLVHHLWLFFAEMATFSDMFHTLARVLVSTAATVVLCLLAQALATSSVRAR